MAVTLFFPPSTLPTADAPLTENQEDADIDTVHASLHRHHAEEADESDESDPDDDKAEEVPEAPPEPQESRSETRTSDMTRLIGRRVTLKPRRTLSLSPIPSRSGDMMMARNLRAARWLDFTDKDDDDGLHYHPSDSDTERRKSLGSTEDLFTSSNRIRLPRRSGSLSLGALSAGLYKDFGRFRKSSTSVKRPLEATLPCQEIQYLDISYQQVQFSPIARKKINYLPVPYHAIHYCEVNYLGERPVKRKAPSL